MLSDENVSIIIAYHLLAFADEDGVLCISMNNSFGFQDITPEILSEHLSLFQTKECIHFTADESLLVFNITITAPLLQGFISKNVQHATVLQDINITDQLFAKIDNYKKKLSFLKSENEALSKEKVKLFGFDPTELQYKLITIEKELVDFKETHKNDEKIKWILPNIETILSKLNYLNEIATKIDAVYAGILLPVKKELKIMERSAMIGIVLTALFGIMGIFVSVYLSVNFGKNAQTLLHAEQVPQHHTQDEKFKEIDKEAKKTIKQVNMNSQKPDNNN